MCFSYTLEVQKGCQVLYAVEGFQQGRQSVSFFFEEEDDADRYAMMLDGQMRIIPSEYAICY